MAMFFGLNIPACSGPLLAAVLGAAAVGGAAKIGQGFWMLALFGFALSLPLLVAVAFGPAQRIVERLGHYSKRAPLAIGALFVALGAWSCASREARMPYSTLETMLAAALRQAQRESVRCARAHHSSARIA
jgi:hypothetical protein